MTLIPSINLLTLIPILPQDFHTTTSDLGTVILLKTAWQPGFKMLAHPSVPSLNLLVTQPSDAETVSPPLAPPVGRDNSLITATVHKEFSYNSWSCVFFSQLMSKLKCSFIFPRLMVFYIYSREDSVIQSPSEHR